MQQTELVAILVLVKLSVVDLLQYQSYTGCDVAKPDILLVTSNNMQTEMASYRRNRV